MHIKFDTDKSKDGCQVQFKSDEFIYIIAHKIYIRPYMQQIDALLSLRPVAIPGNPTLNTLINIRDNLLFSLISELSYNRILLNSACGDPQLAARAMKVGIVKREEQDGTRDSCQPRTRLPLKRDRKITKPYMSCRNKVTSLKNDTKNIPKNYGKAILSFILKSPMTQRVTHTFGLNLPDFLIQIRKMKNRINSIEGLRRMWGSDQLDNKFKKCIRILSYQFMRKHCLRYIFYSKVRNFGTHIKYRQKLIEGIERPDTFNHIKDF